MSKGAWIAVVIIVVAVVAFWFWSSGVSSPTGTLKLQITDAPSSLNIQKAVVSLSNIEVHIASNESDVNDTNSTSGWFTVAQGPVSYDLVNLTNVKEFLGSQELGIGKYTQIRLNVESAKVTINGTEYNLIVPSDKIKLIHPFIIEENKTTTLTLDFNANDSVIKTGNNNYKLQPTIRVIQE